MSSIAIIGGTGYTGAHLASEAVDRGHTVVSWSRNEPNPRFPVSGTSTGMPLTRPGSSIARTW
ncbi:hypothetical protein GCM10011575_21200 [Microlunatus endophyticus]|uniref:NAD-dependent epimerase/dehydratase domain-containing protein n=1 Tax=Microlunatus endophyticus TaxID=1716077 RepID=A0A917S739_9ACTN|nr:NAD-dependent epimerase/dehydratase family protein [Microlunatus endophyticus]GGL62436.1 hypothetical protein GCM10011575_21200 [Microlunatus endophyticus]